MPVRPTSPRLRFEDDGPHHWPLYEGEALVGHADLRPRSPGLYELAIEVMPPVRRRGIATEAGRAVAAFAFNQLGASALSAAHDPENAAARATLEKLGFVHTHDSYELAPRRRDCVRGVVLDAEGCMLLSGVEDPLLDVAGVWVAPGGGIEAGESPEEALRRELLEETGLRDAVVGPLVWTRRHVWRHGARWIDEHDGFYLVRTERFAAQFTVGGAEAESVREWRWWSAAEMRTSKALFAPRRLGELLEALLMGVPSSPIPTGT